MDKEIKGFISAYLHTLPNKTFDLLLKLMCCPINELVNTENIPIQTINETIDNAKLALYPYIGKVDSDTLLATIHEALPKLEKTIQERDNNIASLLFFRCVFTDETLRFSIRKTFDELPSDVKNITTYFLRDYPIDSIAEIFSIDRMIIMPYLLVFHDNLYPYISKLANLDGINLKTFISIMQLVTGTAPDEPRRFFNMGVYRGFFSEI